MTGNDFGPEDMDSTALIRRAQRRGEVAEAFDPNDLVIAVEEYLVQRGLHPELPQGTGRRPMATTAAGTLLRAFGIVPAGDTSPIDRRNAVDPCDR